MRRQTFKSLSIHSLVALTLLLPLGQALAIEQTEIGCNPMFGGYLIVKKGSTILFNEKTTGAGFGRLSIPLLGSTSGEAYNGAAGVTIILLDRDSLPLDDNTFSINVMGDQELWLVGDVGEIDATDGTNELKCSDPLTADLDGLSYLEDELPGPLADGGVTVRPTFGGHGDLQLFIKMCVDPSNPQGGSTASYFPIAILFDGRSTDVDNDGDTDEVDVELVRAQLNNPTENHAYNLDWSSNGVDQADLDIVVEEAKRHVVGAICLIDGGDPAASDGDPNAYDPTKLSGRNGNTPPATTSDLSVSRIDSSTVRLTWTAVADNGSTGQAATGYEVRRSSSAINAGNFAGGTLLTGPPSPGSPGSAQTMDVSLAAGSTMYFALKTKDDVDNWSAASNSPSVSNTAPSAIGSLAALAGRYMVKLTWTAPGEDGSFGTATAYDVRYMEGGTISEANWASATQYLDEPAPTSAGTSQCMVVEELSGCTQYSFAVKTQDASGQWSAISNVKSVTTKCSGSQVYTCDGGASAQPAWDEDADQVTKLALGTSRPNPIRTEGSITYAIPADAQGETLDLAIFDVTGRRTATLATGVAVAGLHRVNWSLGSNGAERVRPGVYFLRLRVGERTLSRAVQVVP